MPVVVFTLILYVMNLANIGIRNPMDILTVFLFEKRNIFLAKLFYDPKQLTITEGPQGRPTSVFQTEGPPGRPTSVR